MLGKTSHQSLLRGTLTRGTPSVPTAPTLPTNTPQGTSDPSTSSVQATLAPITDPTPAAGFPISGGQISLLKTAIAIVNTKHVYCEANILLDDGYSAHLSLMPWPINSAYKY